MSMECHVHALEEGMVRRRVRNAQADAPGRRQDDAFDVIFDGWGRHGAVEKGGEWFQSRQSAMGIVKGMTFRRPWSDDRIVPITKRVVGNAIEPEPAVGSSGLFDGSTKHQIV